MTAELDFDIFAWNWLREIVEFFGHWRDWRPANTTVLVDGKTA
jgi:hypothetical protein